MEDPARNEHNRVASYCTLQNKLTTTEARMEDDERIASMHRKSILSKKTILGYYVRHME